jgi:cell wall-associated NlpC family hydrolase
MLAQNQQKNIKKMSLEEFAVLAIGVPFHDHGRDFQGWDCWGLVVRAYRECFAVELPDYSHISALSSQEAGELFEAQKKFWIEVPAHQERPGNVILLRHGSWPCHVGLVVKAGLMLHVDMDIDTCVEPYNSGAWRHRLIGIYRHAELASDN